MYGMLLLCICAVRCCRGSIRFIRRIRAQSTFLSWVFSRPETGIPAMVILAELMIFLPYLLYWAVRAWVLGMLHH